MRQRSTRGDETRARHRSMDGGAGAQRPHGEHAGELQPASQQADRSSRTDKASPGRADACRSKGWQEFLCLTILAYTGVRRDAASRLRWKDVDLDAGTVTFRDKGSKYAERPISDDLVAILRSA